MALRVYPMRFVAQLYRAFYEAEQWPRPDLRNKNEVRPGLSDRELFETMDLGDIWEDARLSRTYFYARNNRHLEIPDSWKSTIENFDRELSARALCLHFSIASSRLT